MHGDLPSPRHSSPTDEVLSPPLYSYLDDGSKVLAIDSIFRLQIEITQLAGTHRVVLGIELVKALKCLPPLK